MAEVVLKDVCKIYDGGVLAVNKVNLHIKDREFMVLVGPSGCGKSTTLRMVAGLEEISSGTVSIGSRIVNDFPPKDRDIAMVFQNYALSGGQRQRVAVGRAIVRKPEAFLFDEPLSNLDAKMRVQMRTEISKLHTRLETTMIYVTHDQIEAMTMGDRICVMKDGLIQQVDTPLAIYDHPANIFVAGFIGMPPMNFFKGEVIHREGQFLFKSGDVVEIPLPEEWKDRVGNYVNQPVHFGVRPEDIGSERAEMDVNSPRVKFKIEVLEPMGAETYLYLDTGTGSSCIARVDAHREADVGDELSLALMMSKTHLFDAKTEKIIV